MTKKISIFFMVLFSFTSCTTPLIEKQESAFIVMKTAKMRYADMGFISNSGSKVKVEIYASGQPLVKFEINGMNICMSTFECMDKKDFNEKFLSSHYPNTVLENIFKAEPIFDRENLVKKEQGFTQKLTKDGLYDISYSVSGNQRVFRDKTNKILIKVREQ